MLDDNFSHNSTTSSSSSLPDDFAYVGKRRKPSKKKPGLVIGSVIGVLVLIGAVLGGLFYTGILGGNQNDYVGGGHGEVIH
ncbi:MAG: hypothetical protein RR609_03480 [Aurantimicrobium sp.]